MNGCGNLGNGTRHVVEIASEDPHDVRALVRLNASAVHLPLECHLSRQLLQRCGSVRGRLREHGSDRGEYLELKLRETRCPFEQCGVRHRANTVGIHRRASHLGRGQARRGGDGVDHDTLQRSLAQLARQQTDEKFLLWRRRY